MAITVSSHHSFLARIGTMNRPLTPALSRRERGNCSLRVRRAGLLPPNGRSAILPLPAEEGRGEGDRKSHSRFMDSDRGRTGGLLDGELWITEAGNSRAFASCIFRHPAGSRARRTPRGHPCTACSRAGRDDGTWDNGQCNPDSRSEEHTSELQSRFGISYA